MAKPTRAILDRLKDLSPTDREELSSLFTDIEERDTRIQKMTAEREDADKVIAKSKDLEKLNQEQAAKITELNGKLSARQVPVTVTQEGIGLGIFDPIIDFILGPEQADQGERTPGPGKV